MSTPQHCPGPRELDDLELLTTGALLPLTGFNEPGSVVTIDVPAALADEHEIELVDPEGLPLAVLAPQSGAVTSLTHAQYGPFRRLYLTPQQTRERHAHRTLVPVADALTQADLDAVRRLGPVLLVALAGHGTPALSPVALIRATLEAADLLPDAEVVVVPLAAHGNADADHALGLQVLANYAGDNEIHALPDTDGPYPPAVAEIVDRDEPAPDEQGLVLFFTGLSGSGKSTLARALMDKVLEQGIRSVTSLDGDVVRRNLSAGLSFSKQDRETNIRRIGWVAAEISRHGGLAVCSPIAPFAGTRADVREMVEGAGGAFFLVHVATPLEECERRDRKGLYAKARRGEIPEFTGISSPYEEPDDAAVRVDTTGRTIEAALDDVIEGLAEAGYLDLRTGDRRFSDSPRWLSRDERSEERVETKGLHDALNVLFICTANICRSPYMEQAARAFAGDARLTFASAGTHGLDAQPMNPDMVTTLVTVDPEFRSQPLSRDLVDRADLILTAESSHRAFVLEEHPQSLRKVFTLGQFARTAQELPDLHGADLIVAAHDRRLAPHGEDDIADPYRRGIAAAEAAAGRMSTMLRGIVDALAEEK